MLIQMIILTMMTMSSDLNREQVYPYLLKMLNQFTKHTHNHLTGNMIYGTLLATLSVSNIR